MRFIARNMEQLRYEIQDQRRMLQRSSTGAYHEGNASFTEQRHPVFEKEFIPLKTVEEFKAFEVELSKSEVRKQFVRN